MLQFFVFVIFSNFLLGQLIKLIIKVDKIFLQDVRTFSDHFTSYVFLYSKQKHANLY